MKAGYIYSTQAISADTAGPADPVRHDKKPHRRRLINGNPYKGNKLHATKPKGRK